MFTRRYTNFWDGLFRPSKTHLLGSGDVITLTNLVANGNFVDATGWTAANGSVTVVSNTGIHTANGTGRYPYLVKNNSNAIIGHKYGFALKIRVTNTYAQNIFVTFGGATYSLANPPLKDQWYSKCGIVTASSTAGFSSYHQYADSTTANGKVMEVQYVSCVDLTATFGAGSEPSQTDYENWIKTQSNSWFDTSALYVANTNQWF